MNINLDVYKSAGFSTQEIRSLELFLKERNLHWISLSPEGIFELILDNQMLSDFRACNSYFIELYANGYGPNGEGARSWHLDFGTLFHSMMEIYYTSFRKPGFDLQKWAIHNAVDAWNAANMEFHKEHKECKSIGGVQGFCGLLLGYATKYHAENERLRIIGTEISFGHAKEVHLGNILWLSCFLSGRIDVLADTGNFICPVDHKTMGSFRFDPSQKFMMDEGPTGYVFGVMKIIANFLKSIGQEDILLKRSTNQIIMNYISKSIPKEGERFKRDTLRKTTEQLEAYRLRMLCTFEDIFRALVRYAHTGSVSRDTSKCTNWYMHDCTFLAPHRQNSRANELVVFDSFFEKRKIWNTEDL